MMDDSVAERLTRALDALTAELKRYNDRNQPQQFAIREVEFGRANYNKQAQREEEFRESLETARVTAEGNIFRIPAQLPRAPRPAQHRPGSKKKERN